MVLQALVLKAAMVLLGVFNNFSHSVSAQTWLKFLYLPPQGITRAFTFQVLGFYSGGFYSTVQQIFNALTIIVTKLVYTVFANVCTFGTISKNGIMHEELM